MAEHNSLALVHSLSGVLGSVAAMGLTYPLLTITTRLQVQSEGKPTSKKEQQQHYSGLIDALVKIIGNEKWTSLYSGVQIALIGTALSTGIYYYWYELFKRKLKAQGIPLSTPVSLLVAAAAGAINTTCTTPFWVVTTRMQNARKQQMMMRQKGEEPSDTTVTTTIKNLWDEGGLSSFFTGLTPSLILVLNPAIQYMVYEQLRLLVLAKTSARSLSSGQVFLLAAIGKVAATIVTYPYIVIKTRLQAHRRNDKEVKSGEVVRHEGEAAIGKGIWNSMVTIYREEGPTGFYRGMGTKILQTVLNAAFMFTFKEEFVGLAFKTLALFMLLTNRRQARAQPAPR